ncbi:protein phosphatase CheZ [Herbaspirillum sp. LeCh32-8]|uniref:protein phosphatase CheZ n=1 Tax=Herbaspirillum sp. LeCh32-8 TaxID=2821356 RepID=UPI001AEA9D62|nr:protein phosphatase CheZ [Herbaspirillum sp. LeCh32-8]MBP0596943.1 protein phosphatase CheZ [Herbaspirillum sp. LeCh32-8]
MDGSVKSGVQAGEAAGPVNDEVLARIGHMTRNLHDSLRGLGFDRLLERAASDMPDARDRLEYVARMTEQAAQRVLNATELASPMQDRISDGAADLKAQWDAAGSGSFSEADYRALGAKTSAFLAQAGEDSSATKQQLLDIMMAQDFQDLTGQVIKRVTELAHELESQLVQLLVDYSPGDAKREDTGLLNGPQIDPTGKDVIANQGQVDDLLESLGF